MANSLTLGCDCLGEIRYFDASSPTSGAAAHAAQRHLHARGGLRHPLEARRPALGRTEVRRSRRLVVSSISTVGNYEYGFFWYLYLDGTIQLEVKLTGIMSTMAVADGDAGDHARVAPGLAAPYHQHLFNVRLDLDVDGPTTRSTRSTRAHGRAGAPRTPGATPSQRPPRSRRELEAQRAWTRAQPAPGGSPTPHAQRRRPAHGLQAAARRRRRRCWPTPTRASRGGPPSPPHNLWVTPYEPEERRAAGDHPNQHPGGDGLPAWTAADRSIVDTDVVLWHTFGVTHIPRPEDWPVMPVEYTGFSWCRSGSSTATPPSTCHPRPSTAMTEATADPATSRTPQEYHPPVEEYLETMLGLAEEGVPVIPARIAPSVWAARRRRCPRCSSA